MSECRGIATVTRNDSPILLRSIQCACLLILIEICRLCPQLLPGETAIAADTSTYELAEKSKIPNSSKLSSAHDVAGLVLQITGEWDALLGTNAGKLKRGDAIFNGAVLRKITKNGAITIVLTDGSKLNCPGDAACTGTIAVHKQALLLDTWLAAAINMFVQKPDAWANAESRSLDPIGTKGKLNDAVVKFEATQIDLSPIFMAAEDGQYLLRIYKATNGVASEACFGTATVTIHKGQAALIETPAGMATGLYRVKVTRSKVDPSAQELFILASDPQHYNRNQFLFEKASADSKEFRQDASASAIQELLRAYMACLDAECHRASN